MKKLVFKTLILAFLGTFCLEAMAIKVKRTRRAGDGTGNYAFVDRDELKDQEGNVYEIHITCQSPGPRDCPNTMAFSDLGIEEDYPVALEPHLVTLFDAGVVQCNSTGTYSGSTTVNIVDPQGNQTTYLITLDMTYDSTLEEWVEDWEITTI